MNGCGEDWCYYPWDWMVMRILLGWAYFGREGYAGEPVGDGSGGG